ncbi:hypothetical protein SAMN05421774_11257 [Gemmobacter megaterium]|uniref:Uncharacterized protein n=1 Tax=Gemmobacter megaterium TaxID=1086013 RepID=A0A1N7QIJ9_9RHOB|nr:hypothetical protein GCM10011345_35700 [Gemmobacter megaterium]SIT22751.1 hypothetical protein SAMN05421774_11257 [Gemmobacter megaterium]
MRFDTETSNDVPLKSIRVCARLSRIEREGGALIRMEFDLSQIGGFLSGAHIVVVEPSEYFDARVEQACREG